ncbi:hypothetical protein B0T09DRAFT_174124 [Sordaria sp. MPI-SDFR-AT-0083]|nr:hypothetical protein B0T09DRAFT_174124 [Sordaria sp. MPI-SDFR-AT-0083]
MPLTLPSRPVMKREPQDDAQRHWQSRLMKSVEVLLSLGTSNPELWANVRVTKHHYKAITVITGAITPNRAEAGRPGKCRRQEEEGEWMKAFRKDPDVYRSLDRDLGASSDKDRYVPSTYRFPLA